MTREERNVAFRKETEHLFDNEEAWYEQNSETTFEEIEGQQRPQTPVFLYLSP